MGDFRCLKKRVQVTCANTSISCFECLNQRLRATLERVVSAVPAAAPSISGMDKIGLYLGFALDDRNMIKPRENLCSLSSHLFRTSEANLTMDGYPVVVWTHPSSICATAENRHQNGEQLLHSISIGDNRLVFCSLYPAFTSCAYYPVTLPPGFL